MSSLHPRPHALFRRRAHEAGHTGFDAAVASDPASLFQASGFVAWREYRKVAAAS